jgi:hypothetical protein
LEQSLHDARQGLGNLRPLLRDRVRVIVEDGLKECTVAFPTEGPFAGQHLVENNAQRP